MQQCANLVEIENVAERIYIISYFLQRSASIQPRSLPASQPASQERALQNLAKLNLAEKQPAKDTFALRTFAPPQTTLMFLKRDI